MDSEENRGDGGDVRGEETAGDAVEEPEAEEVAGEIEQVPAAESLVEPEGEVSEGAGLFQAE